MQAFHQAERYLLVLRNNRDRNVEAYVANDERTIRSELVQLDGQHRDKIFEQLVPIPSACSIDMAFQSGSSVIRRMRERTDREIVTEKLLIICGMQSKRAE